ncbi:MAG TPA: hypothetical protein VGB03_05095, partial [Acidimicrobiales bacterium]
RRQERQGFDPGNRRNVQDTGTGGPYFIAPPAPSVDAPTTTTTEPPPDDDDGGGGGGPTTTTTTTTPPLFNRDD